MLRILLWIHIRLFLIGIVFNSSEIIDCLSYFFEAYFSCICRNKVKYEAAVLNT